MLYFVANICSFCMCVCLCVHDPSFSIMLISVLLLFFPSFLISPCKNLPSSQLFILASFFFLTFSHQLSVTPLNMLEIVLMSNTPFTHCCGDEVFVGQRGYISFSPVLIRGHFWIFVSLYASAWVVLQKLIFPLIMEYEAALFVVWTVSRSNHDAHA